MRYIKHILKNGLTIVLVPLKSTNIITAGFFVKVGSKNEDEQTSGMAHFLEHMMFKGTKNRPMDEIFRQLDMIGAEYNATTTAENTYYYMYGNSDDTKKILDVVLDIYINPTFEPKAINKEKKVIVEEMRMRADQPYMKLYKALHEKIFAGTPLAREIIGTEDTVTNFKRKDFVDFRTKTYRPDATIFVVTGNINPASIYKMIERALKPLENPPEDDVGSDKSDEQTGSADAPDAPPAPKEIIHNNMIGQNKPFVWVDSDTSVSQTYMLMAFPMYDLYEKNNCAIDLIAHILTSGMSSRLFDALRTKKGITYTSVSYPFVYSEGGVFVIKATMHPEELEAGIKTILAELRKFKSAPVEKAELKKAKNIAVNETLFSLIRPIDYLTYFGLNFLENREFKPDIEGNLKSTRNVKATKIEELAKQIFRQSKLNIFLYGNIPEISFKFIKL
jgi:predicted Zn-dependent peptidase